MQLLFCKFRELNNKFVKL